MEKINLTLSNTLTRSRQDFTPVDPAGRQVNFYVCGPTVYERAHMGNLRTYLFADILRRTLRFAGYRVKTVMNITDVDDKTIAAAVKKFGKQATVGELKQLTNQIYRDFTQDLDDLNIDRAQFKFVRVTDVIPVIREFIIKLKAKGYAYQAEDGSTYFDLKKYEQVFGRYGELVGEKFLAGKQIQSRTKVDEYDKQSPSDFVLWKVPVKDGSINSPQGEGKISWEDPELGPGRPGWHIECSAINRREFGDQTIDIHLGGVDLIFPHHTNEIAQSEALTSQPFVKYWLHTGHLTVDGQKMAKSLDNFLTLSDLIEKKINPLAYRYLILQANYKQTLNFTWESLTAAQKGYTNLKTKIAKLNKPATRLTGLFAKPDQAYLAKFTEAVSRLNTAAALATLQAALADAALSPATRLATIRVFDQVLGLKLI
ncbi:MAG: cysteine--tRNA ligase [Candidatus Vogelbacteria bacterium CG10_big_fil_rev_8_21_14_0_10_49_38]|uniref:Cysteine--tRNA ligase n=1 Tax=Candidatus Vogelbacteria bacterium CG10_big_fil_rev_8_21_14_0_10_49_38 TaxID=1975043 RepID=A0A2H0RH91_9BACT|nr:MAG: cysteine--tRNA ligase [bacterium CG10_49_38]PIR45827.1 MAG: cysteine--tRNA ligase [Candidatus Vogelbacteria bacterium CG10_big_fil_rev_8_21_14_0_10_49_38]